MEIRPYRPADCGELAALFHETVHTINARDYRPEQLDAWAPKELDLGEWDRSFRSHTTLVAVESGQIAGFGDMDASGYLDRLFVHRDFQRRGIASALCDRMEASAAGRTVTVHASITARPFFARRGYRTVRELQAVRQGVVLTSFLMEKTL